MSGMGGGSGGGWSNWASMFGGGQQGGGQGQGQGQGGWIKMLGGMLGGQGQSQAQSGGGQQQSQTGTQSNGFSKPDTSVLGKGSNMTSYDKGTRWVSAGDYDFYVPRNNMDFVDASREGFRRNYKFTQGMDK